jgi:hypothetical protein
VSGPAELDLRNVTPDGAIDAEAELIRAVTPRGWSGARKTSDPGPPMTLGNAAKSDRVKRLDCITGWLGANARAPPPKNQKFADSPLERNGSELPVPRQIGMI